MESIRDVTIERTVLASFLGTCGECFATTGTDVFLATMFFCLIAPPSITALFVAELLFSMSIGMFKIRTTVFTLVLVNVVFGGTTTEPISIAESFYRIFRYIQSICDDRIAMTFASHFNDGVLLFLGQ